jgi:adhesin transport system outer membrane protein
MFCGSSVGKVSAETLQSVVARTVLSNPEVAALRANRLATDEELEAAKGLGKPKVDIKTATGYVTRDEEGEGATGYEADTWRTEVSGVISVPLFDGWKTHYEVERQVNRVDSARNRVADTANSIALQTVQAYLEVQRASSVAAIAERNVAAHRAILSRVGQRASAGKSAEAEVVQARARLKAAEAALVEAHASLIDARSLFISVVGEAPGDLAPVAPPSHMLPNSVEAAVERARAEAPSLAAVRHDILAAEAEAGTAWSEFYPKLDLEVSGHRKDDSDHNFGDDDEFSALLVVRKNLYNGGIDSARTRETRHRVEQTQAIAANAGRLIEKEVRLAWLAIKSSSMRAVHLAQQIEQNRLLINAYTGQFDLGERSLMDILDVQNEIFTTETSLVTERFVGVYNSYRLIAAMGSLLPALDVPMPEEAVVAADSWRLSIP